MRARSDMTRRLAQLEGAFGSESRCKCRVGAEAAGKPWSKTIVLAHPGGGHSGTCSDCGEAIGWPRLNAQPTAERCIACQEKLEIRTGRPGHPTL